MIFEVNRDNDLIKARNPKKRSNPSDHVNG